MIQSPYAFHGSLTVFALIFTTLFLGLIVHSLGQMALGIDAHFVIPMIGFALSGIAFTVLNRFMIRTYGKRWW